jgi:hypothetical protein
VGARSLATPTLATLGECCNDSSVAKHKVKLKLNQGIEIENVDASFPVWSDDVFLGRLRVSKGSVDWQPAHVQMVYRLSWEKFADLMEDNGRKVTAIR